MADEKIEFLKNSDPIIFDMEIPEYEVFFRCKSKDFQCFRDN